MRVVRLVIEVVFILLRWYYDPVRMKQAVSERIERERQERSQKFRKAITEHNEDAVSGMLARLRDRLRSKNRLSDR